MNILVGGLIGFYYAEKELPFPLVYRNRPEGRTGYLELDLQIVDTVTDDIKSTFGYSRASDSNNNSN